MKKFSFSVRKRVKACIAAVLAFVMASGSLGAGVSGVTAFAEDSIYTIQTGSNFNKYIKNLAAGNDSATIGYSDVDKTIKKIIFTDAKPESYTDSCNVTAGAEYGKGTSGNVTAYWDSNSGTMSVYSMGQSKAPSSMGSAFKNFNSAESIEINNLDLSDTTDMSNAFNGCTSLKGIDLSDTNLGKCTTLLSAFWKCASLEEVDLSHCGLNSIENLNSTFNGCKNLKTVNMKGIVTPKLKNTASMFSSCYALKSLDISSLNTANVTNMSYMFSDCISLESLDLSHFKTSKVTNMASMFSMNPSDIDDESVLKSINLSGFDTSNVTTMADMFYGCYSLENLDCSSFNTSKVNNFSGMFYYCVNLKTLDMSNFDFSNAASSLQYVLWDCTSLKDVKTPKKLSSEYDLPVYVYLFDENGKIHTNSEGTMLIIPDSATASSLSGSHEYTISYDANGGSGSMDSSKVTAYSDPDKQSSLVIPLCSFTRDGYTFQGWTIEDYKESDLKDIPKEALFPDGCTLSPIYSDYTLYAIWELNDDANYSVIHEKEQLDGSYKASEVLNLSGTIGLTMYPDVRTYEGYETPNKQGIKITADNKAALTYKYKLKEFNVKAVAGEGISSITGDGKHKYSSDVTLKAEPIKGYGNVTFSGDMTSGNFKMPAKDVEVTAKATPLPYLITYILDGGKNSKENPRSYTVNDAFDFKDPEKAGYTFGGWMDENGDLVTGIITGTTGNLTLTAAWKPLSYKITFDGNGGDSKEADKFVIYGEKYGTLPLAVRHGRIFGGWYSAPDGGVRITENSTVRITKDTTLYAHYTQFDGLFSNIFIRNAKDGSGKVESISVSEAENILFVTEEDFDKWLKGDASMDDLKAIASDSITVTKENAENEEASFYILSEDKDGNLYISSKSTIPVIAADAYRDGQSIDCFDIKDMDIDLYNAKDSINISDADKVMLLSKEAYKDWDNDDNAGYEDLETIAAKELEIKADNGSYEFYVVAEKDGDYYVSERQSIDVADGCGEGDEITYKSIKEYGEIKDTVLVKIVDVNEPDPIPVTFNGDKKITAGDKISTDDITAAYRLTDQDVDDDYVYFVTTDAWESEYKNNPAGISSADKSLVVPENKGVFTWYVVVKDKDGSVYAKKVAAELYFNVSFDAGEGESSITSKQVTYGEVYGDLPVAKRDGFEFLGWTSDKEGKNAVNTTDAVDIVTDTILYAQYRQIRFTVSFNAAEGITPVKEKNVIIGEAYGELPVPERDGYSFDGWFNAEDALVTEETLVATEADHTLTAKWTRIRFAVTFDPAEGEELSFTGKDVINGEAIGELPVTVRDGYEFLGWFTAAEGGSQVDTDTLVSTDRDFVLYAHWQALPQEKGLWVYEKNKLTVSINGAERYIIKDKTMKKMASVNKKTGVVKGKKVPKGKTSADVIITGQKRVLMEITDKKGRKKKKKVWVDVGEISVRIVKRPVPVKTVKISKLGGEYDAHDFYCKNADGTPVFEEEPIKWISSNTDVATVSDNGIVHIVGKGSVKIIPIFAKVLVKKVKGSKPAKYEMIDGKLKGVNPIKIKVKLPKMKLVENNIAPVQPDPKNNESIKLS